MQTIKHPAGGTRAVSIFFVLQLLAPLLASAQPAVVMNETDRLFASDGGPFHAFGSAVAIDGDTLVVGAYLDDAGPGSGSAYVFVRSGTTWTQRAKLVPAGGTPGFFGWSVALSGDVIVVGAHADDDTVENSGSAYVFEKPPGGWAGTLHERAKLRASDPGAFDQFGGVVAISGDTIVVTAYSNADLDPASGAAYVFTKPAEGWTGVLYESARLRASTTDAYDYFGYSAAISGDLVAIGAIWVEDNGLFSGAAYVFEKPAAGWSGTVLERAKLLASDGIRDDAFGESVTIDRDTVYVGATQSYYTHPRPGATYVFERPAAGWSGTLHENAKLLASDGAAADAFGVSVGAFGGLVVVGAHEDDDNGFRSGAAYIFERPADGWSGTHHERAKLLAADGGSNDALGFRVTIAGRTAVASAHGDDNQGEVSGSAYLFELPASLDGPFASSVRATPNQVLVTEPVTISATIGGSRPIESGEYEVRGSDGGVVAHGLGNDSVCPSPHALCPSDGAYDAAVEFVAVTIPPNSLPAGALTVCVRGTDISGITGTFVCNGLVTSLFTYFFEPFFNPAPALNYVGADRGAFGLRFTLNGDYGMNIFAPGFPQSVAISCSGGEAIGDYTTTSGLFTYKGEHGRYEYAVKIEPAWRGTCRQFLLGLDDGTTHAANMVFAN